MTNALAVAAEPRRRPRTGIVSRLAATSAFRVTPSAATAIRNTVSPSPAPPLPSPASPVGGGRTVDVLLSGVE